MGSRSYTLSRAHPIRYSLCGECWTVTADDEWLGLNAADDGSTCPVDPSDAPTFYRCPHCGYDHVDDDADPGVWSDRGGIRFPNTRPRADRGAESDA